MIQQINSIEDVRTFFRELLLEDLNFHPDTPFEDYVNVLTKQDTYTNEEAQLRNQLLEQCFEVCGKHGADIYGLCIEIFQPLTGRINT